MSICDRCDRPASEVRSVVLFRGDGEFSGWDLRLCGKCAGSLPRDLSMILGKEPET